MPNTPSGSSRTLAAIVDANSRKLPVIRINEKLLAAMFTLLKLIIEKFTEAAQIRKHDAEKRQNSDGPDYRGRPCQNTPRSALVPARPRAAGLAEVHRPVGVGPPTAADRAGAASGHRVGRRPMACWSSIRRPFAKKGTESVGVQRQWCGRLGKIENCQVGIYLGYVSRRDHALVDFRLYLPKEWAQRQAAAQEGRGAGGDSLPHAARTDAGDAGRDAVRCCRTRGLPATTNWAVARGFARNCGRATNAICWPCRPTPWCVT